MREIPEKARGGDPRLGLPFLRIPPFPGGRIRAFEVLAEQTGSDLSRAECVAMLRKNRVGGSYWGAQPELPTTYVLVRTATDPGQAIASLGPTLSWFPEGSAGSTQPAILGDCDPWHMLTGATAVVCYPEDEIRLIAAILGVPLYVATEQNLPFLWQGDVEELLEECVPTTALVSDPFGDRPLNLLETIELSGFWRKLIDSNRSLSCGVGFAFWKQKSVLPLLWGGGESEHFFRRPTPTAKAGEIAIWRSKAPDGLIAQLERDGTALLEVEDGFLRSNGLGANCVPPLSITVDRLGAYFDPASPSELEELLQHGEFDSVLLDRAGRLRETIVAAGLGKYERGGERIERPGGKKRHILVTGQVEDDRSILSGGGGLSNLDLLRRVRANALDAYILYKPHPDVAAGHRVGHIEDRIASQIADKLVTDVSISSLIAMVDEVHVNTSLAGFEALMRHKPVTTYGVPFYAGWGLTHDLGPVPSRRSVKRSLDELVAATLLLYPRYLDPVSGLPAPAEVVVDRLCAPRPKGGGILVALRRLQGRVKRLFTMRQTE